MAVPTIDAPPEAPVRGEAREDFQTKSNVFIGWFSTLVTQLTTALGWVDTKVGEVSAARTEVQPVLDNMAEILAADDNAAVATQKAAEAAASAASVDPDTTLHTAGSGLPNEGQTKAQSDAAYLPIGGNAASASQATKLATARTINGVPFDGSANIIINVANTTAQVGTATAGLAVYALGSYIFGTLEVSLNYPPGTNISGSLIRPAGLDASGGATVSTGTGVSGTWKIMGYAPQTGMVYTTLFLREF